jgi:hypothetical protein
MRNLGIVVLGAALAGCASLASDIAPAYVSPVAYLRRSRRGRRPCPALKTASEPRTLGPLALRSSSFGRRRFFVGGDKQTAAELAQMKGQMVAVEQASIAKKCNIEFQGKPPGPT